MNARPFLDTTILIYCLAEDDPKSITVEGILARGGIVSVQVLHEFTAVARRKLQLSWKEIRQALEAIEVLCDPPMPITHETHQAAVVIAEQSGFHIYDSLILASAVESGCSVLLSEDMQHGQVVQGITIQNPFRAQA
jgi:predicted nucleic acid-binding protein